MRIRGPDNVRIKELNCSLFKTRVSQPDEKLYLSIKEKGIKDPLLIAPVNGNPFSREIKYEIVDGFRRFSVAKSLNFKEVPALVIEGATEKELHEIAILRNTLQNSLAPIEKALYIKKLKDTYNYANVEIASLLGVQKSYITELLLIFNLGKWAIRQLKKKQGFTVAHARLLARCDKLLWERRKLKEIIQDIMSKKWSLAHLHYELQREGYLDSKSVYTNFDDIFDRLSSVLNHKPGEFVKKFEVSFNNMEDLRKKLREALKLLSRFTGFLSDRPE